MHFPKHAIKFCKNLLVGLCHKIESIIAASNFSSCLHQYSVSSNTSTRSSLLAMIHHLIDNLYTLQDQPATILYFFHPPLYPTCEPAPMLPLQMYVLGCHIFLPVSKLHHQPSFSHTSEFTHSNAPSLYFYKPLPYPANQQPFSNLFPCFNQPKVIFPALDKPFPLHLPQFLG